MTNFLKQWKEANKRKDNAPRPKRKRGWEKIMSWVLLGFMRSRRNEVDD